MAIFPHKPDKVIYSGKKNHQSKHNSYEKFIHRRGVYNQVYIKSLSA